MTEVFAFACRVKWAPEWGETYYNRASAGQAKHDHFLHVSEAWENTKFTDIRVRKIGPPMTSEQFLSAAKYRGLPNLRCGHRVRCDKSTGIVVSHNASANFDVLFDDGPYKGKTLSVHPSELSSLETEPNKEVKP